MSERFTRAPEQLRSSEAPVLLTSVKGSRKSLSSAKIDSRLLHSPDTDLSRVVGGLSASGYKGTAVSLTGKTEDDFGAPHMLTSKGRYMLESRTVKNDLAWIESQMRLLKHEAASLSDFLAYLSVLGGKARAGKRYVCTMPIPGYCPPGIDASKQPGMDSWRPSGRAKRGISCRSRKRRFRCSREPMCSLRSLASGPRRRRRRPSIDISTKQGLMISHERTGLYLHIAVFRVE